MYGKMTTSRMGIIGNRLVSDFSFEVSMCSVMQTRDRNIHRRESEYAAGLDGEPASPPFRVASR
jgi:hypothetical protein